MKGILLLHLIILFSGVLSLAQKPIGMRAEALFRNAQPEIYTLFSESEEISEDVNTFVRNANALTLHQDFFKNIREDDAALIRLVLPTSKPVSLDLYRTEIFNQHTNISTSDGRAFLPNPNNRYYRGIIHGDPHSLAIVSIFDNRIQILFSDRYGNKRIQQTQDGSYILYADHDIQAPKNQNCLVDEYADLEQEANYDPVSRAVTGNCVQVYVECDYESYLDNGSSIANTEEWIGELWNEVIAIYENEEIIVEVSDIFIHTSPFPAYDTLTTLHTLLYAFVDHVENITYDGRLTHLMSTRPLGGGIAYLNVLCSNTLMCAVSTNLTTNIIEFPTYSANVEIVAHELGHNMGSHHTHRCVWNGNNTQIDDCGNQYEANNGATPEGEVCYNPSAPILPSSGTIMSYCHLIAGVGINFNNGFGIQPGDLIRTRYNNAACNTGTCLPPPCTSVSNPASGTINVDINQNLQWPDSPGAHGYKITIGTSPTNGSIVNNVDLGMFTTYTPTVSFPFNTLIYVTVIPYNAVGDASGCTTISFTTEENVAPVCTQVIQPENGAIEVAIDATIHWSHAVGNQNGYTISIGTTSQGTDLLPITDVGNVNSYDPPVSFPYATIIYVTLTPYWSGGSIDECVSQSFTTIVPVAGDFCSAAIPLPCSVSMEGTTLDAIADPGLPFCTVNIEAPGIWYTFVGDGQNTIISTCGAAGFDTQLNAYKGSCTGLICISGNNDFCSTSSLITFPTIAGTTYFILVQGKAGQQGTYTLTRSCYGGPFYCMGSGKNASTEWIDNVTFAGTENSSGSSSYSDYTQTPIIVSRGATYSIQIAPGFSQNPRNQYYKVWIDYNHDGDFADSGEQVLSVGPTQSSVSGNITIPLTAVVSNTRMRVAMRYNTFPGACATFAFGEVEDYMLSIKCNLVTSTSDSGNGSLRNVSMCVEDGQDVLFAPSLHGQIINVTTGPITVDGQWRWMAPAGSNIQIKAGNISRLLTIPVGKSVEIQHLKLQGGTASQGSAIENEGTLILSNCEIRPATSSTTNPIFNKGIINIFGVCDIRY